MYCLHAFCVSESATPPLHPKKRLAAKSAESQQQGQEGGHFEESGNLGLVPGGSLGADWRQTGGKLCRSRKLPRGPAPAPAGGFRLATGALGQEVPFRGYENSLMYFIPPSATVPAHLFSAQSVIPSDGFFPYSKASAPQSAQLPGWCPRGTMMTVRSRIQGLRLGNGRGC